MSLPGSPALYRLPEEKVHASAAPGESSSPTQHSHSPRLSGGTALVGFLPAAGCALAGLGNGGVTPLVPGLQGGLGSLGSPTLPGPGPGPCGECKLVEVHGVKVASFSAHGQELICLPQVFDLFLKHLVGGLHTVYTKLKRLDITPAVCTVEQVRVLRGLGAIQPGVNRCKLISRTDFEILYQDCTSASSRPGRPPKRCSLGAGGDSPRLLHPGLLSPNLLSHTGLTAAAMAELQKLHKMKMMMRLQNGNESDNDDLHSNAGGSECSWDKERPSDRPGEGAAAAAAAAAGRALALGALSQQQLANRLELPFVMMPHPLLPVGLPPASVAMAMSQMNQLGTIANMAAAAQQIHLRQTPVIKERACRSPSPSADETDTPRRSRTSSSASSSPERLGKLEINGMLPIPTRSGSPSSGPLWTDAATPAENMAKDKEDQASPGRAPPATFPAPFLFADSLSSVETLLTNIQGLLKVAVENARVQDKQIQAEKRELKMELDREREMRESLERQLTSELQSRVSFQKRLKKEKKAKRKLQEALEFESKRRRQPGGEDARELSPEPDESLAFLKTTVTF
ncbi:dachshund homolog 2-like isoform X2 [Syngnathus typhle]|uniref:dachshund homolog 2-like isoform X2 n=1 Tax=Syngnathus typhle TaxID=161592 RepID=UPI002A6B0E40|nr:dachshund homolog 2-like isoform X2 [Syngnathus typhle]